MEQEEIKCKKASFETAESAQKRIAEIWKSGGNKGTGYKPVRAYLCKYCGKFHTTHKSKKAYNKTIAWKDLSEDKKKQIKKEVWINKESEYWANRLGIDLN